MRTVTIIGGKRIAVIDKIETFTFCYVLSKVGMVDIDSIVVNRNNYIGISGRNSPSIQYVDVFTGSTPYLSCIVKVPLQTKERIIGSSRRWWTVMRLLLITPNNRSFIQRLYHFESIGMLIGLKDFLNIDISRKIKLEPQIESPRLMLF